MRAVTNEAKATADTRMAELSASVGKQVADAEARIAKAKEDALSSLRGIAAETAKVNLRAAHNMPYEKAVEYERDLQTICFATEDAREGRAAFAEKRSPVFRRR